MNQKGREVPIYIVSKGRADSRLTSKALEKMNCPYFIVIEQSDFENYSKVIDKEKILILPEDYLNNYDTFDDLGRTKSTGPGAARNFCWDHAVSLGAKWHWVMDDNISYFGLFNDNLKVRSNSQEIFLAMEDFCNRYENLAIAGPNYFMFIPRKQKQKPFVMNTRIYSCLLIRNDIPYRWRGRYNEDTDLSLRVLKDGFCTVQFNAFFQYKMPTQTIKGGNHADFYSKEGTLPKSQMQVKMHPDVSKLVWRFGRWHHLVDYKPFKNNKLIRKKDYQIKQYNFKLKQL